jgi:DNA-binding response OmpR family regulator
LGAKVPEKRMVEKGKRILVVDDERDVRSLVCHILLDQGYEVDQAVDGRDALDKILARAPDLVVLDLMMPELDGWQVMRELKELASPPRVVVLSAFGDVKRVTEAGAIGFLAKPFRFAQLVDTCQRALAS